MRGLVGATNGPHQHARGALALQVAVVMREVLATERQIGVPQELRVLVAVRENEQRVEFLGYDARLHKLVAFSIGGALAGLAGCLFVSWGNYVSPTAFSVVQSAQIIIWIMVGGAGTLLGPVFGALAISWLTVEIGTQQWVNANVILGAILLIFVLLVPRGIAPMISERLVPWLLASRRAAGLARDLSQERSA